MDSAWLFSIVAVATYNEAALQHFDSCRDAIAAAGLNLANVTHRRSKHLDRESMFLWLRSRQAAGQTLGYSEVCLENRDYASAIKREFRSWAKAMEAAFPPIEQADG